MSRKVLESHPFTYLIKNCTLQEILEFYNTTVIFEVSVGIYKIRYFCQSDEYHIKI